MLAPEIISKMSFPKEKMPAEGREKHPLFRLMVQCFGAQAVMCGILLLTSKRDKQANKVWFASVLPFFAFDYLAWREGLITDFGAIGDAAGNIVFSICSAIGAGWLSETGSK